MKTWELLCVDRETGTESVQRIPAPDEATAFSIASVRGMMVAKVIRVHDGSPAPLPPTVMPTPSRFNVGDHAGTTFLYLGGAALLIVGFLIGFDGLTMYTAIQGTHNLGLLNEQIVLVIAGSALFLGGIILLAVARLVGQLFRWGRPIAAYLEAARARP